MDYGRALGTARPPHGWTTWHATAASWCFRMGKLMDVHEAIVDQFKRYPYRNALQDLESTEDEKRWLEGTNHFGEAQPDVARKVRRDVGAGRWTPVGGRRSVDAARGSLNSEAVAHHREILILLRAEQMQCF
ncbi:hypothetical protein DL768_000620 [Monosporascus sp. mg162]|nr:hypothetical protein DL768_000620 [Monosporascus sp. mg162]